MEPLLFLFRSSRRVVIAALLAGVVRGLASAALVASIHAAVAHSGSGTSVLLAGRYANMSPFACQWLRRQLCPSTATAAT